MKMVQNYVIVV